MCVFCVYGGENYAPDDSIHAVHKRDGPKNDSVRHSWLNQKTTPSVIFG